MSNVTTTTYGQTTYKQVVLNAGKDQWSFLVVSGQFNYISIRKETNNPHKMAGKEFKNWQEVENHYKSANMQIAIMSAQTILN